MPTRPLSGLDEIEHAIRGGWSRWTADPVDQADWSPANPAVGQCGCTALLVQDVLGGDLLIADVTAADGSPGGVHYSNRLTGGAELDLTREQFRAGETIGPAREVARAADTTRGRLAGNYHLLAARTARTLARPRDGDRSRPVTVKAVCLDDHGRALLCRNHRGEWELPGGRPEIGELFADCVRRELREETGLAVEVGPLIDVVGLEVLPERCVDVVAFACDLPAGGAAIRVSDEHTEAAFFDPAQLRPGTLADAYRRLIDGRQAVDRLS